MATKIRFGIFRVSFQWLSKYVNKNFYTVFHSFISFLNRKWSCAYSCDGNFDLLDIFQPIIHMSVVEMSELWCDLLKDVQKVQTFIIRSSDREKLQVLGYMEGLTKIGLNLSWVILWRGLGTQNSGTQG